jgi:glycosidase
MASALLIAEASALDGYYFQHGFDAAYDCTTKLGEWAWNEAFADESPDLEQLRAALANSTREPGTVLRFLNNNDTGTRFITRHGVGRTRAAAAMLLTLPGLPLIYNGDEVGAEFLPYEEQPLDWKDRHGLVAHYTKLVELRKEIAALSSADMELVQTNRDDAVLAYTRQSSTSVEGHQCDDALVLLNFTDQAIDLKLFSHSPAGAAVRDRLTNETFPDTNALRLKPFDTRVLTAERCHQ